MRALLFSACLLSTMPLLAQDFACPASPQAAGAGWHAFPAGYADPPTREQAERIELYDGDPRQGATSIPDDHSGQIGVAPVAWTLAGQPLFMVCTYTGIEQRMLRSLPAGLTHCQANNEFEDMRLLLECR